MPIGEAHTFCGQPVDVRSLDDRVSQATQVAFALIVGHHQNDVGPRSLQRLRSSRIGEQCQQGAAAPEDATDRE